MVHLRLVKGLFRVDFGSISDFFGLDYDLFSVCLGTQTVHINAYSCVGVSKPK